MINDDDRPTARPSRTPLFTGLMTFPAACFILTLFSDIAYAKSSDMPWESCSIWLLTIGLIAGGIFVLIGLIQAFGQGRWPSMTLRIGYAIVLILEIINAFIHSRDAYTSVVPEGITLSVIVVLILLATWVIDYLGGDRKLASARRMRAN
jgi:uncharacterized membrane protein